MAINGFPHLAAREFINIINVFENTCQTLTANQLRDWKSISIKKGNESSASLMIIKNIVLSLHSKPIHDMIKTEDAEENEQNLEEIDEEVEQDVFQQDQSKLCHLVIEYSIVYSLSYQVPVLYFTVTKQMGSMKQPITALEEVYEYLVPASQEGHVKDNDILGAISSIVWV
jgi:hypothetical protein